MAVSPANLIALSTEEQSLITKAESLVDAELREKYVPGQPVAIRNGLIRFIHNANPRVLAAFKSLYSGVGWVLVEYNSDEGKWFNFLDS